VTVRAYPIRGQDEEQGGAWDEELQAYIDSGDAAMADVAIAAVATEVVVVTDIATGYTVDWLVGRVHKLTMVVDTTITFANLTAGRSLVVEVLGAFTPTFSGVTWPVNAGVPAYASGTLYTFDCITAGTIFGAAQQGFSIPAGSIVTADVADGAVTLAKQANLAANSLQGNNTGSPAVPLALTVAQAKTLLAIVQADVSGLVAALLLLAPLASPTLVTPDIGAATGTSLAVTGALTSSGGGIGYATGAGGTVTQATNKTTGVTLNKITGQITMAATALASGASTTFVLTNSTIGANDIILTHHHSVGTTGAYFTWSSNVAAGSCSITVRNSSLGSLSEAIVLTFVVVKAAAS
jgi:hypothetical protein